MRFELPVNFLFRLHRFSRGTGGEIPEGLIDIFPPLILALDENIGIPLGFPGKPNIALVSFPGRQILIIGPYNPNVPVGHLQGNPFLFQSSEGRVPGLFHFHCINFSGLEFRALQDLSGARLPGNPGAPYQNDQTQNQAEMKRPCFHRFPLFELKSESRIECLLLDSHEIAFYLIFSPFAQA